LQFPDIKKPLNRVLEERGHTIRFSCSLVEFDQYNSLTLNTMLTRSDALMYEQKNQYR